MNLTLTTNQALINLAIRPYFAVHHNDFAGSIDIAGTPVTYSALTAPTFALTGGQAGNVTVTFNSVSISLGSGGGSVIVTVTGTIAVAGSALRITGMQASVSGAGSWLDRKIAAQVQKTIEDRYAASLANFPIPVVGNVLGSGISVQLANAAVVPGAVTVGASLTYQGQGDSGTAPPAPSLPASPAAALAMNQQAIQTAIRSQSARFPMTVPVNSIDETSAGPFGHFGKGVRGSVKVGFPTVALSGNQMQASFGLSFDLQGGIEAFGAWTWVGAPIPSCSAQVQIEISANGQTVSGKITKVNSINWPPINLPPVISDVAGLLRDAVSGQIGSYMTGQSVELFSLPPTIEGVPVALRFSTLGVSSSMLQAVVGVAMAGFAVS
jgi:hypothetical protein